MTSVDACESSTVEATNESFVFGTKSQARLTVFVTELLTASGKWWVHVIRNFREQWKAIKDSKKETQLGVPVIMEALTII